MMIINVCSCTTNIPVSQLVSAEDLTLLDNSKENKKLRQLNMLKLAYTLATIFKRDEKNKLSFFGGGDGKKIET